MPPARLRRTALATAALAAGAGAVALRRTGDDLPDPAAEEPFGLLAGERSTVTTEDGITLAVEEFGPADADTTLVFAHGWSLSSQCWHYQVRDLAEHLPGVRVITYDQRGHGRSDRTPRERANIAQLGRDLLAVIAQRVGDRPVVLAGHSMGGMTIMALAEQRPDLFGDQVVGVALVATSAGRLGENTFGMPRPVAAVGRRLVPRLMERQVAAEAAGKAVRPPSPAGTRRLLFGGAASPAQVRFTTELTAATPAETTAAFWYTFEDHDRRQALSVLRDVPVSIFVGANDKLCPEDHGREMAALLPHAELVVYPGAGHMLPLERHEDVTTRIARLARRAFAPADVEDSVAS